MNTTNCARWKQRECHSKRAWTFYTDLYNVTPVSFYSFCHVYNRKQQTIIQQVSSSCKATSPHILTRVRGNTKQLRIKWFMGDIYLQGEPWLCHSPGGKISVFSEVKSSDTELSFRRSKPLTGGLLSPSLERSGRRKFRRIRFSLEWEALNRRACESTENFRLRISK